MISEGGKLKNKKVGMHSLIIRVVEQDDKNIIWMSSRPSST